MPKHLGFELVGILPNERTSSRHKKELAFDDGNASSVLMGSNVDRLGVS
jgi:hypothetical protein